MEQETTLNIKQELFTEMTERYTCTFFSGLHDSISNSTDPDQRKPVGASDQGCIALIAGV